ncbi:MAG: glycosyltransferase family 4 protein [Acidithiobacillales bacterium]
MKSRVQVFVDLAPLAADGSSGGAARFILKLLNGLLAGPSPLDLHLLVKPGAAEAVRDLAEKGAVLHRLGEDSGAEEPRRFRRTLRRLPASLSRILPDTASLSRLGADLLFSPLFTAVFHEPGLPHVAVAYDFQELTFPGFFDKRELKRRRAFRRDLGRADRVVAISEATKKDAVEKAGVDPGRVTVLPPVVGPARTPLPTDEESRILGSLRLAAGGYAAYPANYWPHKNHERLLAAFARAQKSRRDMILVLCGALDAARQWLVALARNRGLSESVRVLPYLSEDEVTAILQGARFLVYPSFWEGFGIPVLEALSLGTPVACSDLPVLGEVAGEDALYFNPEDEASIADAMELLWTSEETRQRLSRDGRVRGECWAAVDVVGAYRRLLEG